jgi:hypothetical protein
MLMGSVQIAISVMPKVSTSCLKCRRLGFRDDDLQMANAPDQKRARDFGIEASLRTRLLHLDVMRLFSSAFASLSIVYE